MIQHCRVWLVCLFDQAFRYVCSTVDALHRLILLICQAGFTTTWNADPRVFMNQGFDFGVPVGVAGLQGVWVQLCRGGPGD